MKTNILLTLTVLFSLLSYTGRADDCIDFADMNLSLSDYNNDAIFPIGSTFASAGDLKLIKTKTANWTSYFEQTTITTLTDSLIYFHGYLTLDVSNAAYSCRKLIVESFAEKLIVDGDTMVTYLESYPFVGNGYVIDTSNNTYIITGSFDEVQVWIPTGIMKSACLTTCTTGSSNGCLDFSGMYYPVSAYNNDSIFPVGSVLLSEGPLQIIKLYPGVWGPGFQQTVMGWITDSSLYYHGYLSIDVSNAPYSCRELHFKGYADRFIVDGDTIMTFSTAFPYVGNGFVLDSISNTEYLITGSFDEVQTWAATGYTEDICLSNCSPVASNGCLDFANLIYPESTYNDDTLYPAGSVFLADGPLQMIKTKESTGSGVFDVTVLGNITDSVLYYHGFLTFDVSTATFPCRTLNLSGIAVMIVVDGDTITTYNTSFPYTGAGFVLDTVSMGEYQITGTFDQVDIWSPTGLVTDVCLDSCGLSCQTSFIYTVSNPMVQFVNTSLVDAASADQLFWDFGDGTTSTIENPNHTYASPGTYYVCLVIVDFDCPNPTMMYCDSVTITGCNGMQFIITPNNDGVSDDVYIKSGAKIYDRNGFLVRDVKEAMHWNGLDNSGNPLPMGYYTVFCSENEVFNVTILR